MFNYYNEEFYIQYFHQIFFSVTEALSTVMVLHICNRKNKLLPWKLLIILNLNLLHIVIASWDQFIKNIFYHEAKDFEAVRDLALMTPDILHVLVPFFEIQNIAKTKRVYCWQIFYKEEIMLSVIVLILMFLLAINI